MFGGADVRHGHCEEDIVALHLGPVAGSWTTGKPACPPLRLNSPPARLSRPCRPICDIRLAAHSETPGLPQIPALEPVPEPVPEPVLVLFRHYSC